ERPPLSQADWEAEFGRYQASPEFKRLHSRMTLDEFKFIFWMEYAHRMWGRLLGLAFVVPGAYFAARGYINAAMAKRLGLLLFMGGTQGLVGWWMVRSGLQEPEHEWQQPRVSPYRLAAHLVSAFAIFTTLTWTTLDLWTPTPLLRSMPPSAQPVASRARLLALPFAALVGVTATSGAFVAGLDAGHAYNEWPTMDGQLVPHQYWQLWEQGFGLRNFFENTAAVQFNHRTLATTTAAAALGLWAWSHSQTQLPRRAQLAMNLVAAATVAQFSLGVWTLLAYVPVHLGSAHQANALNLFTAVLIALHALRPGSAGLLPATLGPWVTPAAMASVAGLAVAFVQTCEMTASDGVLNTQGIRRLMIREMVLENFKSYAGVQRVGPFHKARHSNELHIQGSSFSSVVGPNGSGKSNVIDAMLFVFGRRAKQLRFNKVSELIHNSTNFRNLESARVTVHFQQIIDKEGEDFDVVPNTSLTVARTANRSNTSDYYINDRKASTKEVTDMLKGLGIDLDNNRFLILQGEVEQISMMKPKAEDKNDTGLLEYLEDIIGTDKYVAPIEEAAKRLEEMNDKRQTMIQRLKISEKEKEGLEGQKAEAEIFLSKQADMLRHRVNGHHIYITQTQSNLAKGERQAAELRVKQAHEKEKHKSYDKEAKATEAKYAAAEKEFQAIQKALEDAEEEMKGYHRKDAKMLIEQKNLEAKLKKASSKILTDSAQAAKLEAEVAAMIADEPHAKERLQALQQGLAAAEASLEAVLEGIKEEVEKHHKQLSQSAASLHAQVRGELAPWEKKMGEVSGRISVSAGERDMLARKAEDAKRRLDAALKAQVAAQHAAGAKQRQIKDIEAATAKCKQQMQSHKQELAAGQAEETRLKSSARELSDRVAGLRSDAFSSTQQSGLVVALMTAKAKGEISGVYGRLGESGERRDPAVSAGSLYGDIQLFNPHYTEMPMRTAHALDNGDLGAIDGKYDIAVSTAVGGLDYIVVETAADAQRCVEFLRKNNLGVATCLILEKQKHLAAAAAQQVDTPPGAPRLYDLVKIKDDKLRPAFFYAMGNTLVADSLDEASRIAYGQDRRFRRVVTLQGQLIAESGTMSGGGGKPQRGRMALGTAAPKSAAAADAKEAAVELRQAEQQLEQVHAALGRARDTVTACEQALLAADKQLQELESAAPKACMEAQAEADKAADIQQRLEELRRATEVNAEDAARIAALSTEIAREEQSLAALRQQTAGLEKQASALQAQIDNAGKQPAASTHSLMQRSAALPHLPHLPHWCLLIGQPCTYVRYCSGERLKKAKAQVAKAQKEVQEAEGEGAKRGVQLKANTKQADKLRKDVAKEEKEVENIKAELNSLLQALDDLTEQAVKVSGRGASLPTGLARTPRTDDIHVEWQVEELVEATKEQMTKKQSELESAGAEHTRITTHHAVVRKAEMDIEAALEHLDKLHKDESHKIQIWLGEIDKLQAQLLTLTGGEAYMVDADSLAGQKAEDFMFKAQVYEADLEKMSVDLSAIEQWRLKAADYAQRAAELEAVTQEREEMITLGGDAELELVDSLDPFSEVTDQPPALHGAIDTTRTPPAATTSLRLRPNAETHPSPACLTLVRFGSCCSKAPSLGLGALQGIVFSVRPPRKSWKNISNLSGGEKTLSSLSLVFALHHYKPTPLYVMDEIDAALDFKNVSIVGHYIKERTKNAQLQCCCCLQFVIISLRNNMFELADRLVGIYKTDNTTKTVTINPGQFTVSAAAAAAAGQGEPIPPHEAAPVISVS
ncbi:hypothetical protein QJQ45_027143, partial [Haematococcus lacustris]